MRRRWIESSDGLKYAYGLPGWKSGYGVVTHCLAVVEFKIDDKMWHWKLLTDGRTGKRPRKAWACAEAQRMLSCG